MPFDAEGAAQEQIRAKKPRDEADQFDHENQSEFEGVSDSGEGDDAAGNDGLPVDRQSNIQDVCQVSSSALNTKCFE